MFRFTSEQHLAFSSSNNAERHDQSGPFSEANWPVSGTPENLHAARVALSKAFVFPS